MTARHRAATTDRHGPPTAPPRRPGPGSVPLFLGLTFTGSWLLWLAAALSGGTVQSVPTAVFYALGGCGPSLTALGLRSVRRARRRSARPARPRPPAAAVALALGLGALPAGVAGLLLPAMAGTPVDLDRIPAVLAGYGGPLLFVVAFLVAGPLSEEFGWRGHLQPRLRARLGPAATAVVLGGIWALWHVPLFLLPGTVHHAMGLASPAAVLFFVSCLPQSYLYWYVSERRRGGVSAAVALHFAGNASGALLPVDALTASLTGTTVVTAAAVVVALAVRRAGHEPGAAARP